MMVLIFSNVLMFYQLFLSPKMKRCVIISDTYYIQVASRAEKPITMDRTKEKSQKLIELKPSAQSSSQKEKN